ncbi:MAG: hypothetical protein VX694_08405 [Planctomycetota bacterium]|nr:hypothetical protein [Planctomycetota bacterium]
MPEHLISLLRGEQPRARQDPQAITPRCSPMRGQQFNPVKAYASSHAKQKRRFVMQEVAVCRMCRVVFRTDRPNSEIPVFVMMGTSGMIATTRS